MNPTFTIKLGQQIYPGLVVTGKFDGKHPSIACATTGGKILIHSPHEVTENEGNLNALRYLNLNKKVTALASGCLNKNSTQDLLYIGTQSNLLAYDVERNADSFFVDVTDGINSLLVGTLAGNKSTNRKPLVVAGGNCSILGFDQQGTESFWTVTGDNVSSMALVDLDSNSQPYLLVGSDDYEIRLYKQEDLIYEITEADRVTHLESVGVDKFSYGLANGTLGLYSSKRNRLWRVKTKNKLTALNSFDIDQDGVPEIFSGWSNGNYNIRRLDNGEVMFKESMESSISGILKEDYRMDGKEEIMVCSETGEIRAYLPIDVEFGTLLDSGVAKDNAADQKVLNELQTQKLELMAELNLLEKTMKNSKSSNSPAGALPPNTELSYSLTPSINSSALVLTVEANTDVQIVNLIIIDLEGVMFADREAIAVSPKSHSKVASIQLKPTKYSACKIRIQTHVAPRSFDAQLFVFEKELMVPKFSMFTHVSSYNEYSPPRSKVSFLLRESAIRIIDWMKEAFVMSKGFLAVEETVKLDFANIYKNDEGSTKILKFVLKDTTENGQNFNQVTISCDDMELVSELVQDIARYFNISELESEANFPIEFMAFEEVIHRVNDLNSSRQKLSADMADDAQKVKAFVVRAEDARLMMDMDLMRKAYKELHSLNSQLLGGYNIRASNHETLLSSLKEVNQMIQKAANLRVGKAKARVISESRQAVKNNNMQLLFTIFKSGQKSMQ